MNIKSNDGDNKERQRVYERNRDELLKRQLSNAESFDKAILTYSSAGLAISLAFLKDYGQHTTFTGHWILYLSWAAFVGAIISTIASYMVIHSQATDDWIVSLLQAAQEAGRLNAIAAKWTAAAVVAGCL